MAAAPAAALELGDLTVHSSLGQPLRASIAYALAPNEELSDLCVAASAGAAVNGMPGIGRTKVSVGNGTILLTGDTAIREPLLGTRITISCPYTPKLVRDYTLFVDLRGIETAAPVAAAPPASAQVAREPSAVPRRATATARREPVSGGARYQVQPGDSLSQIVQRIENRSVGLWPAVNAIFDANPHAFTGNDPNRLKVGTWLEIPSFDGTAPVISVATTTAPPAEATVSSTAATVYEPPVLETTEPVEETVATVVEEVAAPVEAGVPRAGVSPVDEISAAYVPELTDEAVVESDLSTLRPGDVVAIPEPATSESTNAIPTTIVSTGSRDSSTSMLAAMVGAGLALIAGLVIFGRRIRERFGSTPIGPAAPQRVARDRDETVEAHSSIDFDLDDNSPTDENPVLDANLFDGQGFAEGTNADIGQDFGFARTTNLDIELPFEPVASISDAGDETDIIPPLRAEISSILESEVLPEDDDYDMSVIVDATKMPQPEDVTERDLHAVPIDDGYGDDIEDDEDYSINRESDFDILQQDYEDEMTATQALNEEIARAAEELAASFDKTEDETKSSPAGEDVDRDNMTAKFDVTAELPLADNDETVEMPRKNADGKTG
jgi:hypothetical protein